MRIAYLANPTSSNGIYRCAGPAQALAQFRGHQARELTAERRPSGAAVRDVDVLHIHRYCEDWVQALARAAKAHGATVVWDNDDDMGALPKAAASHKHFGGYAWSRRLRDMQRLFRFVDLVTTPSQALAEQLAASGAPRTRIVENFVPDHFLRPERRPRDGITIGWVAGLEHQVDAEQLPIRAVLQRLLEERPDVRVMTVGLGLGLRGDRYRHTSVVPLRDLHHAIAELDIAIAPLSDVPFNRSRSNVKLKEYAAAGVPWLASPIGPYAEMGERHGGRLVPDDGWYEALVQLVDKPRVRRKLARRAARWAAGQTLCENVRVWERTLVEALALAGAAS